MQPKQQGVVTVGLFGTCGNSQWRAPFIDVFNKMDIAFFNPVVPDWSPECATIEAEHLVEDEVILFPVTGETTGFGSLGEVGFSISAAIASNDERVVVVYVAPILNEDVAEQEGPKVTKESTKARALVLAHLKKQSHKYPNVYVVDSMDRMLEIVIPLYNGMKLLRGARTLCM